MPPVVLQSQPSIDVLNLPAHKEVWLERQSSGFTVALDDACELVLSKDVIYGSKCLSTAYEYFATETRIPLLLPPCFFQAWHDFIVRPSTASERGLDALLQVALASDFLADHRTLRDACALLASRAFAFVRAVPLKAAQPTTRQQQAAKTAVSEVLSMVPEHVAVCVQRAALATMPPRVHDGQPAAHAAAPRDAAAHPLQTLMAMLPPKLHPALLRAHTPGGPRPDSLALPPCDFPTAAVAVHAVSRTFAAQLTALTLHGTSPPARGDLKDAAMEAAMHNAFAPLATMTALERLSMRMADEDGTSQWVHSYVEAAAAGLQSMPRLAFLRLSQKMEETRTVAALSAALPVLGSLRSLDLSSCGLCGGPGQATTAGLAALATALRALSVLTLLSLARNPLGSPGWAALAPAAATLPLLTLNLEACKLFDPFSLYPGTGGGAGGAPAAFSQLQRLQMSGNRIRNPALQLGRRLPQLTHLHAAGLPLSVEAEERLMHALAANEALRLQALDLGECRGSAAAAESLCRGLERWTDLRTVSLTWHPHATAPLLQLAPRFAALRSLHALELRRVRLKSPADVPQELAQCSGLTRLKVGELGCNSDAAHAFAQVLAALTSLRSVEITWNREAFGAGSATALVRGICSMTLLTRLKLRCVLGSAGTAELVRGFGSMQSIRDLSLSETGMGAAAVGALAPVLGALSVLCRLDLGGNRIRHGGAIALAAVLPCMRSLRELSLRGCELSAAAKQAVLCAAPEGMQRIDVGK